MTFVRSQKSFKRVILWMILIGICFLSLSLLFSGGIYNVKNARKSLVRIIAKYDDFKVSTGFVIGDGKDNYIITSAHCVKGNPKYIMVWWSEDDIFKAEVYKNDFSRDICILKTVKPINYIKPLPLFNGNLDHAVGNDVYSIGFPRVADEVFEPKGAAEESVTIAKGILSAVKDTKQIGQGADVVEAIQLDINLSGGNSGGPVIDKNGLVLGMTTFVYADTQNINGALGSNEIIDFLEENDINYKSSMNLYVYAEFAQKIAALVLLAAVLTYLVFLVFGKQEVEK